MEHTNNLENLEKYLYIAVHGLPKKGDAKAIWESIKSQTNILKEAIEIRKDKFGESDMLKGMTIAEAMLTNYKSIDKEIYQTLINTIYTNVDIARAGFGPINGRASFLLMSLWNHDLKLTQEQKDFAVREALNKLGTKKDKEEADAYKQELEKQGITDDIVTTINIDGSINPIGLKTKSEYMNRFSKAISSTQAHGSGPFDIRYQILRNPNWTLEEKQKLINDFWEDDEEYDETLEDWEWDVVNDEENYKGNPLPPFDRYELFYVFTYDMLMKYYGNKETADRIWAEIEFCKQMHKLRPQQWESKHRSKEKKLMKR